MQVKIRVDDASTLAQLHGLSVDAYVASWAEAVRKLAVEHALKLGSNIGPRVADAVTIRPDSVKPDVLLDGPESKMAAHIHTGGSIRSGNGKVLAIPTRWNKNKDDFAGTYGENYFIALRSKKRNRAYLFKNPGKDGKLGRPMFVLTPKTKPQKPRPWWPSDSEVDTATAVFFDDNF